MLGAALNAILRALDLPPIEKRAWSREDLAAAIAPLDLAELHLSFEAATERLMTFRRGGFGCCG